MHVGGGSLDVLSDEAHVESVPEGGIEVDVLKHKVSAGVGNVTSQNSRRQDASMRGYVPQSDIGDRNSRLGVAWSKGVQHAARSFAVGLFHLLGSNVNAEPDGCLHLDILEGDVLNNSRAIITGVCLDINCFHGSIEGDVFEVNVFDARNIVVGTD